MLANVDETRHQFPLVVPALFQFFRFLSQGFQALHQFTFTLVVDGLPECLFAGHQFLLHAQLVQFTAHVAEAARRRAEVEADPCTGGVQHVDGLVRELTASEVAGRHVGSGFQGAVGDQDLVGLFVDSAQATEDVDRLSRGWLIQRDGLEAAAQGRVFLKVFLVLAPGGGGDGPQLATGQGRLEQVGGVGATFTVAGADQGVGFVDKQDDGRRGAFHRFNHAFQAFFELAFHRRTGLQCPHVQSPQFHARQALRHIAIDDTQGQAFNNGAFAHAGIADNNGVVLATTAEDVDHLIDFGVAAHHWVQFLVPGQFGEVGGVALERVHVHLRLIGGTGAILSARLFDRPAGHGIELAAQLFAVDVFQTLTDLGHQVTVCVHQQCQHDGTGAQVGVAQFSGGDQPGVLQQLDQQRRERRVRLGGLRLAVQAVPHHRL